MHVPWLSKQMFSKERPCPRMDNGGKRFPVRPPRLRPRLGRVQCAVCKQVPRAFRHGIDARVRGVGGIYIVPNGWVDGLVESE